ncbi:hypothetical protein [Oceaniradius stylonematis]|uniref:hypothetical protein n=1 Tax=Oceaniradius stylonematis TaxID=2184161 RepID=UPI0035CFB44C
MENAVFALFMMGCGHQLDVCRPVDTHAELFEDRTTCEAGLESAARNVDTHPIAVGKCVAVDPASATADMRFKWFFAANGELVVDPLYGTSNGTVIADRADRLPERQG